MTTSKARRRLERAVARYDVTKTANDKAWRERDDAIIAVRDEEGDAAPLRVLAELGQVSPEMVRKILKRGRDTSDQMGDNVHNDVDPVTTTKPTPRRKQTK